MVRRGIAKVGPGAGSTDRVAQLAAVIVAPAPIARSLVVLKLGKQTWD
jgi:hypothetical protein